MASTMREEARLALQLACRSKTPVALVVSGRVLAFDQIRTVDVDQRTWLANVQGRLIEPHIELGAERGHLVQLDLKAVSAVIARYDDVPKGRTDDK